MSGQWWRTQPSSSNDVDHLTICARRLPVSKLHEYLLSMKPDDFLLCSRQCGLLIEAMERVASWLAQWERKTLPAPFVQDMLTLATCGVRLLEEFKRLNSATWLAMAAFKLESRQEFLELFQGFLQNLKGYVDIVQGPLLHTQGFVPPLPLPLQSVTVAGVYEVCIKEAKRLITKLELDLNFLTFKSAVDRRALEQRLEQGGFAAGEESKIARLLVERLKDEGKQNNPFQLDTPDIMNGKTSELLGEGSFANVYGATWMGKAVAVKQFKVQGYLEAELQALLKTSHVNVMCAIAKSPPGSEKPYLLMERMKGDLGKFVGNLNAAKAELPILVSIDILLQIASGMAHLHEKKVMHRDLKPENILFNRWPPISTQRLQESPADFTAKITDFGNARIQTYNTTEATAKSGTEWYRAPEVLQEVNTGRAQYSLKADVFSFGMVCYKLLTKSDPCLSKEKALEGDYSELRFPPNLPQAFIFLTTKCWARDRQKRPSFAEICYFLALFKSIVLNTTPASSGKPPLYVGIRDDVLVKLGAFLGRDWLIEEATLLGIGRPELDGIDERSICLQITNKLAISPKADYFRWLRCCFGVLI